jgi:hypothetical protein
MIAILLTAAAGWASPFDADFRIAHLTDYDGLVSSPGDDYYSANATRKARHAYVILHDETAASWVAGTTDVDGEVEFTIVPGHSYHLSLYAQHDLSGRVIKVKDDINGVTLHSDSDTFASTEVDKYAVNDVVFDASDSGNEWMNAASAASFAIYRRPNGFRTATDNGANYDFAMVDPSDYGSAAPAVYFGSDANSQTVALDPDLRIAYAEKTVIVHELPHAMQHWAIYPGSGNVDDYNAVTDDSVDDSTPCTDPVDGHQLNSKEYHSMALQEGMAFWVAAVVFNNLNESDCRLLPGSTINWNHLDPSGSPYAFSCEGYDDGDTGGVEWSSFSVDGLDYLGDTHDPIGAAPPFSCLDDGDVTGVSTDLDWIRFLWDLNKNGVPFSDIVDAYGDATPYDWDTLNARDEFEDALATIDASYATLWHVYDDDNGIHR